MSSWAASKFTPGKFLGSTGANILSVKQLQAGGTQAWAKRVSWRLKVIMLFLKFQGNCKTAMVEEKSTSRMALVSQVLSIYSIQMGPYLYLTAQPSIGVRTL